MSGQILTVHWWPHANGGLCFTFWLSHSKINLRPRNDIINSFSSSHAHSCPLHISLWLWTETHSPLLVSTNRVYFSGQQWWKKKDYSLSHNDKWVQYTCVLPTNQTIFTCLYKVSLHALFNVVLFEKTMLVIFSGFEFFEKDSLKTYKFGQDCH